MTDPQTEPWLIERLAPGGEGLARLRDGRVAFVRGVVPGDLISVRKIIDRGRYVQGEGAQVIEASPDRVVPVCPAQGRCGGCDWMQLSEPAQRAWKLELVREALRRTGGFSPETLPVIEWRGAPNTTRYRSRLQLQVGVSGQLGFFQERSHELVSAEHCLIGEPALGELLSFVLELGASGAFRGLERLELRISPEEPARLVRASPRGYSKSGRARGRRPVFRLDSLVQERLKQARVHWVVAGSPEDTSLDQSFELPLGLSLKAPAAAFTQVNQAVNQLLVGQVLEWARAAQVQRFLDLYCGAGNFSLPLGKLGCVGLGVELNPHSIAAAERGAAQLSPSKVEFLAADVVAFLRGYEPKAPLDLVVLDPPRNGAKELLPALVRLNSRWIVYCACDPVTLARDLKQLSHSGYRLQQLIAFDMFPQTHHVEVLALLERTSLAS